jgi:transcriptional regulator with XRE-family HTH domain
MTRRPLSSLGVMVREKRGTRKLREVAQEIRIGPATLMRVENGRIPDVTTFGKICNWLGVDPGSFLGFQRKDQPAQEVTHHQASPAVIISAHLKAEQTPKPQTVQALASMILFAMKIQAPTKAIPDNGDI